MSGCLGFEARVEPMEWGRSTHLVLRRPDEVAEAISRGGRRVEGEIGDHAVELALTRAPALDATFLYVGLYVGRPLARALRVAPGDVVEARLRSAPDDVVAAPPDVAAALRAAGRTADREALTPSRRRGLLHGVATAKRAPTRAKRIAALARGLSG